MHNPKEMFFFLEIWIKYRDDDHDVRDVLDDDRNQILDDLQIKIQVLFEPLS